MSESGSQYQFYINQWCLERKSVLDFPTFSSSAGSHSRHNFQLRGSYSRYRFSPQAVKGCETEPSLSESASFKGETIKVNGFSRANCWFSGMYKVYTLFMQSLTNTCWYYWYSNRFLSLPPKESLLFSELSRPSLSFDFLNPGTCGSAPMALWHPQKTIATLTFQIWICCWGHKK